MRSKALHKWFTKVFLVCVLVLVYIGGWCEIKHPLNPNLKLVVGDTTTDYDSIHCSNPIVSPAGDVIYYLCADVDSLNGFYELSIGKLHSVSIDGNNGKELLEENLHSLSVSRDGRKLAAQLCSGNQSAPTPESLILVIHIDTLGIVGIDSLWVTPKGINKIVWSTNDEYLYYNSATTIYRWHLSTSNEVLVMTIPGVVGFDLLSNDSLYLDSMIYSPEVEPINEGYIIGISDMVFGQHLQMRDIKTRTAFDLSASLKPYDSGLVGFPYWFPDGNTIVFAACPYAGPSGAPAEIWILENLFEQIE